jgi:outer membrane protein assembly factor BamB
VTFHFNVERTGLNDNESLLTLANVNVATFGLLRLLQVDGRVDAQPLYLSQLVIAGSPHNVVFAATENDSVYAFDADSGALLWQHSLMASGETTGDGQGCNQVVPTIGVTSTPVIDRKAGAHGEIFVVGMTRDKAGAYHHRLHALDITTGAEMAGPTEVMSSYPIAGGTTTSFDPGQYEERAALVLSGGVIFTSWTSHCDTTPYTGWVMGYSEATLAQSAVLNLGPNSFGGPAIWMSGDGPAADAAGNLYLLTANGSFETILNGNGFPAGGDYGNSFVKISTVGGRLAVADYFALFNTLALTNADQDLGSGGEMLLPDLKDATGVVRHLVVGAGKDGNIYLVNRDSMGHFSTLANNIWQQLSGVIPGGAYSTPAYFNGTIYYSEVDDTLKAFALQNAKLILTPSSQSVEAFGYPGGSPAISSYGAANGIVWAHENSTPAVLHAFDAGNLGNELYNSNQAANGRDQFGPGNKFITPAIADGKVLVGTRSAVAVFGLLP